MSVPTLPYPLTDGTFAYGSQVYADLQNIVSAMTANLDSTNMNLARGIGAGYITPGAFQAGAYSISPSSMSTTPLTLNGLPGQTANILSIATSAATTVWVDASGVLHATLAPVFPGLTGFVALNPATPQSGAISVTGSVTASAFIGSQLAGAGNGPMIYDDGVNTLLRPSTSIGSTYFETYAGGVIGFMSAGFGFQTGSSFYGPSGASVNGNITAATVTSLGILYANGGISAPGQSMVASNYDLAGSAGGQTFAGNSSWIYIYSYDSNNLGLAVLNYNGVGYAPFVASNITVTQGLQVDGNIQCNNNLNAETITVASTVSAAEFVGSGAGLSANSVPNAAIAQTPVISFDENGTPIAGRIYFGIASVNGEAVISFPAPYSVENVITVTVENPTPDIGVSITRNGLFGFNIYIEGGPYAVHWMSIGQ